MDRSLISASLLTLLLSLSSFHFVDSTTFKIVNGCRHTIWPGILTGANRTVLTPTGFTLESGKSRTLTAPKSWSGRLWARTLCSNDSSGQFSCATADCGSGKVECAGAGAIPPATLAEFTLNGDQGLDFYDVSLVDGYNLPMLVVTMGGTSGGCNSTGCVVNLNGACPAELRVARGDLGVACRSACEAFGDPQYCCTESFSTPDTCQPSVYSAFFKNACPRSYTYAYDDKNSTFTCAAADYIITFCPSPYRSGSEDEDYESDEPDWLNEGLERPDDDDIFPSRETIKKKKRQPLSFDQGADEGWYFDPENEDLYRVHNSSDEECEDKYPEFIEEDYKKEDYKYPEFIEELDWLNEGLKGPNDDDIFPSRETIKKNKRQPLSFDQRADEGWYFDPENEDLHSVHNSLDEECEDKYPEFIEEDYKEEDYKYPEFIEESDWLNECLERPDDDDICPLRETIKKKKRQPFSFDQGADEGWYFDLENEDLHRIHNSSDEECKDKYPEFIEEVDMKKPQLKLGMKFATPQIFRKAMKEWNIQHGYDIKYIRNDNRVQYYYPEFDNSSSQPRIIDCPKFSTFPNLDGATHFYLSPLVMAEKMVG